MWKPIDDRLGSIKTRLLAAVLILVAAILIAGAIAMYGLETAGRDLNNLHRQTLSDVTQALELSKQSADLASSAPYLFSLRSPFLVAIESAALLKQFETTKGLLKPFHGGVIGLERERAVRDKIINTLDRIHTIVRELVDTSNSMIASRENIRVLRRKLLALDKTTVASLKTTTPNPVEPYYIATELRALVNLLVAAAAADNYITLGEYRRRYVERASDIIHPAGPPAYHKILAGIKALADDNFGVFEVRRQILGLTLDASNQLFQIQRESRVLNDTVFAFVRESEAGLARHQNETAASIISGQVAIVIIVFVGLIVAFGVGKYVTFYVAGNLVSVADVMNRLAGGELDVKMPAGGQRRDEIGKLLRAFSVFRDNAFKIDRLNYDLLENSALLQSTFDNMTSGLAVFNKEGVLITWNPRFPQVLEIAPERLGDETKVIDVLTYSGIIESQHEQMLSRLSGVTPEETGLPVEHDYFEIQTITEKSIVFRSSRLPNGGMVCLFSDVTERQKMSETMQRFRNLESLGKLTGEVAHDFNNLLSVIHGNLQLLNDKTSVAERSQAKNVYLERAIIASERGASLTERLLAFARKQQLRPETVDLAELIDGMADLIEYSVGEEVSVILRQEDPDVVIEIDPGQLENAILNLCINSGLAISGGGSVTIETRLVSRTTCEIVISDTGCGMPVSVLERVFEPFFTTRSSGQGSGLGLSMVFGFIKQSGGEISIDSQMGAGTQVHMSLPLAQSGSNALGPHMLEPPINQRGHGERVLVVEDMDDVRQVTEGMIRDLGYETVGSDSSAGAIEILNSDLQIAVIFTDINLRGDDTGWRVIKASTLIRPEVPAIVTSAVYNSDENVPEWLRQKTVFVPKPHALSRLTSVLAQAVEQYNTGRQDHNSRPNVKAL